MAKVLGEALARLRVRRPDVAATLRPATAAEIAEVERRLGHPMPPEFREFLEAMGRGTGKLQLGCPARGGLEFGGGRLELDVREIAIALKPRRHPLKGRQNLKRARRDDPTPRLVRLGRLLGSGEDSPHELFLHGLADGRCRVAAFDHHGTHPRLCILYESLAEYVGDHEGW